MGGEKDDEFLDICGEHANGKECPGHKTGQCGYDSCKCTVQAAVLYLILVSDSYFLLDKI